MERVKLVQLADDAINEYFDNIDNFVDKWYPK